MKTSVLLLVGLNFSHRGVMPSNGGFAIELITISNRRIKSKKHIFQPYTNYKVVQDTFKMKN